MPVNVYNNTPKKKRIRYRLDGMPFFYDLQPYESTSIPVENVNDIINKDVVKELTSSYDTDTISGYLKQSRLRFVNQSSSGSEGGGYSSIVTSVLSEDGLAAYNAAQSGEFYQVGIDDYRSVITALTAQEHIYSGSEYTQEANLGLYWSDGFYYFFNDTSRPIAAVEEGRTIIGVSYRVRWDDIGDFNVKFETYSSFADWENPISELSFSGNKVSLPQDNEDSEHINLLIKDSTVVTNTKTYMGFTMSLGVRGVNGFSPYPFAYKSTDPSNTNVVNVSSDPLPLLQAISIE